MSNKQSVVLKDVRRTYILELPSFKGSKVEIYDGVLFGQARELENEPNDFEKGLKSMLLMIKCWNFTDEDGNELEINSENINKLPAKDLTHLMTEISKMVTEQEKNQKKE